MVRRMERLMETLMQGRTDRQTDRMSGCETHRSFPHRRLTEFCVQDDSRRCSPTSFPIDVDVLSPVQQRLFTIAALFPLLFQDYSLHMHMNKWIPE